ASARAWVDRSTATCAAVLTGISSFNTIYASTESSDALCTVIFMTAVYFLTIGLRHRHLAPFAAAGLLAGIAPQFRPNLILLPILFAAFGLWSERTKRRLGEMMIVLACAVAALAPWIVRNYKLTATIIPTSVHGGVQHWYARCRCSVRALRSCSSSAASTSKTSTRMAICSMSSMSCVCCDVQPGENRSRSMKRFTQAE